MKPRFISLFSGCGGFDLGFVAQGYSCAAAFDYDRHAVACYNNNFPSEAIVQDLSVPFATDSSWAGVDAVVAGSPCQGFSTIGANKPDDARNDLFSRAVDLSIALKPRVVLLENVATASTGRHSSRWERAHLELRSHGYSTADFRLCASQFSVPQSRRRALLLAWKDKELVPELPKLPGRKVRDALGDIAATDHDPRPLPHGHIDARIASHIEPGIKLSNVRASARYKHTWDIPDVFGVTSTAERKILAYILRTRRVDRMRPTGDADPVALPVLQAEFGDSVSRILHSLVARGFLQEFDGGYFYDFKSTFNGKYHRLHWDRLAPTVDGRYGCPRQFLHPSENRGITVREAARLQSFPDSFTFVGSAQSKYRMIGNAVPPAMASALAGWIASAVLT